MRKVQESVEHRGTKEENKQRESIQRQKEKEEEEENNRHQQ